MGPISLWPQRARPSGLPDVLVDECAHLLQRLLGDRRREVTEQTFPRPFEDGHIDLTTSFAVLSDEFLTIGGRMRLLVATC